jgi:hypothetical protein
VCSMPPRLQVLRPPIQPNHRLVNPRARTDPAGWHDLAQCWREIRGPPCDRLAHWDHQHGVGRVRLGFLGYASSSPLPPTIFTVGPASSKCKGSSALPCALFLLSLSQPGFFAKCQCQPSRGFRNFRFTKATETASSCMMDTIFRSEFTGTANGEHDGALRRFEYHRDLILAGTWLDFKGAPWEWLMYSHVTAPRPACGLPG